MVAVAAAVAAAMVVAVIVVVAVVVVVVVVVAVVVAVVRLSCGGSLACKMLPAPYSSTALFSTSCACSKQALLGVRSFFASCCARISGVKHAEYSKIGEIRSEEEIPNKKSSLQSSTLEGTRSLVRAFFHRPSDMIVGR